MTNEDVILRDTKNDERQDEKRAGTEGTETQRTTGERHKSEVTVEGNH
jgi:hypothetical protein